MWFPQGNSEQRFLVGMVVLGCLNGGVLALATVPTAAWSYLGILTAFSVTAAVVARLEYLGIAITLPAAYVLLGAGWLIMKAEGELQACGQQCPAEAISPGEQSVEDPAVEPVVSGVRGEGGEREDKGEAE